MWLTMLCFWMKRMLQKHKKLLRTTHRAYLLAPQERLSWICEQQFDWLSWTRGNLFHDKLFSLRPRLRDRIWCWRRARENEDSSTSGVWTISARKVGDRQEACDLERYSPSESMNHLLISVEKTLSSRGTPAHQINLHRFLLHLELGWRASTLHWVCRLWRVSDDVVSSSHVVPHQVFCADSFKFLQLRSVR